MPAYRRHSTLRVKYKPMLVLLANSLNLRKFFAFIQNDKKLSIKSIYNKNGLSNQC